MNYMFHLAVAICIFTMLGMSVDLLLGRCGRLTLANAALFGIGAYSSSLLMVKCHWSYMPSAMSAILLGSVAAGLIGVVSLKLREDFFVLATIACHFLIYSVFKNCTKLTEGLHGLPGIPRPAFFGTTLNSSASYLLFSAVLCGGVFILYWQLNRSPFGRALRAVRDDPIAVVVLGKSPYRFEMWSFLVSGGIAAIAGTLWASWITYIDPTDFGLDLAVFALAIVIVGGAGNIAGPLAGTATLFVLEEAIRLLSVPSTYIANTQQVVYGGMLVLLMMFRRKGLFGEYDIE